MYTASLYGFLASLISSHPEGIDVSPNIPRFVIATLILVGPGADLWVDWKANRNVRFRIWMCCFILRSPSQRLDQGDGRQDAAQAAIGKHGRQAM